jgi:hypothetical protein
MRRILRNKRTMTTLLALLAMAALVKGGAAARSGPGTLAEVRSAYRAGNPAEGYKLVKAFLQKEPANDDALYLEGEYMVLAGRAEALGIIERLRRAGRVLEADILELKADLFLGDEMLRERLSEALRSHPGSEEVRFIEWRRRLDEGDLAWAAGHIPDPEKIVFGSMPYEALFMACRDDDPDQALSWARKAAALGFTGLDKRAARLSRAPRVEGPFHEMSETELPLVACGPYFGIEMEDAGGRKIRVSLDTGTGGRGFMIHDRSVGDALTGPTLVRFEKAIQYHYMKEAADLSYKSVSFRRPRLRDMLVGYFEGSLKSSDGVFSPFAFKGLGLTVDPAAKKAVFRDRQKLARYVSGLRDAVRLPYRERGGWIYVKGEFAGHAALMMVETGSRDLNINGLAAARYGVKTRPGTVPWNGRDVPVVRPDGLVVDIGGIAYTPSDGLVDDFALGNVWTGCGSAGDIGPEFLRNFRFTIDPFGKALILEPLGSGAGPGIGSPAG